MPHVYQINGSCVKTGDIICTTNGANPFLVGQFWRLIGMLIPGEVDHIAVYVGPRGRCVEAGPKFRVVTFTVHNKKWEAASMTRARGPILDTFYGVAYPLAGRGMSQEREDRIRENVASYCLRQAQLRKPYNLAFTDSQTEEAFYCSQLAYKAYLREGIDLNTGKGVPRVPGTKSIIYPQEIWSGCKHVKA